MVGPTQGSSHKLLIKITVRGERFGLTVTLVVINWFVPIVLSRPYRLALFAQYVKDFSHRHFVAYTLGLRYWCKNCLHIITRQVVNRKEQAIK